MIASLSPFGDIGSCFTTLYGMETLAREQVKLLERSIYHIWEFDYLPKFSIMFPNV